ncbi:aminopeptidase N [Microlunatus panaciterrae]|uniref:Aminopeptidase N n=1 Tax=Microlunatus panaciterrae TaxID=400768 RepID=A0ABS2RG16_9ACTN|nr:aminopeptidase N [Microlunatus panaciterrae]MBM7797954.1 aminopeptidase N [Microlunatus panaciterrae]
MPSLLRSEAQTRADLVSVDHTHVVLDLTGAGDHFRSTTTITFSGRPGSSTFVDFKGAELLGATLNGSELDPDSWTDGRLPLPKLAAQNTLVLVGLMAYSSDGEGLHRHVDPADHQTYLYAMSFLDAAPRWFGCFDQPDLKSSYTFDITAPADWTVLGNGPSERVGEGRWRITPSRPLSSYYVTLVAGPYASLYDQHDGIPLGIHVRASLAESLAAEAADIFHVTKASFDYFHRVFGVRYPFGEYHQAFVPDFNAGAMENPGCVTFRDSYIFRAAATTSERGTRAGTIAHEMAHMWFGDLVTMRWWDDLWLNESFAEYMSHRACTESTDYPLWVEFGILRKDWGSVADQAPSTHPVAGNGSADAQSALNDFDGISYAKGAAVLRQLVGYLGDETFFAGLNAYFTEHAFGNAEFADLISAWTRAGARDLGRWAASWLQTAGLDTLTAVPDLQQIRIARVPPRQAPADRTHAISVAGLDSTGAELFRTPVLVSGAETTIALPAPAYVVVPDAGDETWAKIRFGAEGWSRVGPLLPGIADDATRVVVYNSIRDGVRNAELAPAEALQIILESVPSEPHDIVVRDLLTFAQTELAGPYCPPAIRASRRRAVHQTAREILDGSGPGSDRQLAAFRIAVRSSDDPQLLRDWLASRQLPPKLSLDPELTWSLVSRLSLLTGEEALIDEALRADPSAAAHTHAARARASLPTEQAKAAAFELLMRPSEASAYTVYATARGFFEPSQSDLTAPYVDRYFAEIVDTAKFRTGWALGRAALLSFPFSAADESTLKLAEETLRNDDLAAPLRRSLVDGTDELRRAVTSLLKFG